jgi:hypothetical protein
MLRKLKWQIPGEPLAARYNWYQGPEPGRGPAVEKHWPRTPNSSQPFRFSQENFGYIFLTCCMCATCLADVISLTCCMCATCLADVISLTSDGQHTLWSFLFNVFIFILLQSTRWAGSSVGIAIDYGLDGPRSNPGVDEIFRPSKPTLGPTQSPVQWVPGLSRG